MGCPQRLLWRDLVLGTCRGGAVQEAKPASPLAAGSLQTFTCVSPQARYEPVWMSDQPSLPSLDTKGRTLAPKAKSSGCPPPISQP